MELIDVAIGGLRALLFVTALFSAATFIQEVDASLSLICALWNKRIRSAHIVRLAAAGWFIGALSSMFLTGPRIFATILYGRNPVSLVQGWDAIWVVISFAGLSLGFYLPVLAILWYRDRLLLGLTLGVVAIIVCLIYGSLAYHLPPPV